MLLVIVKSCVLSKGFDSISELLIFDRDFGLGPVFFIDSVSDLEGLFVVELAQILSLLVFKNREKIRRVHLEVSSETFCHQSHQALEVTELSDCSDHESRVLDLAEVLFELLKEGLSLAYLKVSEFFCETTFFRVKFALNQTSFLSRCKSAALSVDVGFVPVVGCLLDC